MNKSIKKCINCWETIANCECGDTELYSNTVFICPYCGHEHEPGNTDGEAYDEATDEWQCEACDKEFVLNVYMSYSWTTMKK